MNCGQCGGNCAKLLVILFSCVCLLCGVAILGVGIWSRIDSSSLAGVLGNIPQNNDQSVTEAVDAPSLLERGQWVAVSCGIVLIIVSVVGFIGAIVKSKICLLFFAVSVSVIICLELAGGVVVIFFRQEVDNVLQGHLYDAMNEYEYGLVLGDHRLTESQDEIEQGWDVTQITLECCGVVGYNDWLAAEKFKATYQGQFCSETVYDFNPRVPLSCCKTSNPHRYPDSIGELYFKDVTGCLSSPTTENCNLGGCYEKMLDRLEFYALILIIVCFVIIALEICAVIASCCLVWRPTGKQVDS